MGSGDAWRNAMWNAIGRGLAAHAVMLRDADIVDDSIAASLLTAFDGARGGSAPVVAGSLSLVAAFDDRVDSLIAAGAIGAVRIGRARHDLAATAQRLVLRDRVLALAAAQNATRLALLDLAESHVFTLLPVWSGSSPLQPTNFAHFLTGTIAPMGRSARALRGVYDDLDRSPLGSGALAGRACRSIVTKPRISWGARHRSRVPSMRCRPSTTRSRPDMQRQRLSRR
jgi:argininosuccinate lyase